MSLDGTLSSYVKFDFTTAISAGSAITTKAATLSKAERLVNGVVTVTFENGSVFEGKLIQQGSNYISN
jgi:hypothetical protein